MGGTEGIATTEACPTWVQLTIDDLFGFASFGAVDPTCCAAELSAGGAHLKNVDYNYQHGCYQQPDQATMALHFERMMWD